MMPNRRWKKERYKESWQLGDTVNTSIGQGYMQATPIQLLQMTARIATGTDIRPSLLKTNYNNNDMQQLFISLHLS